VTTDVTDDAAMLEALGLPVKLYAGSPLNLKVTTEDDLRAAEALLEQATRNPRIGARGDAFRVSNFEAG
jgi:2-C-methyl-D-erythritol 4-phosphate cytidylyltransferase